MKSIALKITIVLVSSLLFATQASAYDITSNARYKDNISWGNSNYPPTYRFSTPNGNINKSGLAVWAPINGEGKYSLYYLTGGLRTTLKEGHIYSVIISFDFSYARTAQVSSVDYIRFTGNSLFRVLGVNKISGREFCSEWSEQTQQRAGDASGVYYNYGTRGACGQASDSYEIIVQGLQDYTGVLEFGNHNQDPLFQWTLYNPPLAIAGETDYGSITVQPMIEWELDSATAVNEQQQQAGEQAQQDGQQGSNQAQSDADTNTATMFQTVGNILGAITDTPAGDCSLNGNMGNLDLGNLNLCQAEIEPIRPIIRAVLYLVMALATYKIMIWVIGAIAGLINWVQTGNDSKETEVNNG